MARRKRLTWRRFAKDVFIPHKGNGRHPHALRREVVLGALSFVIMIEIGVLMQTLVFFQNPFMTASVLPAVIADLTNQERSDNGIGTLSVSPLLTEAAQDKANDMAAKGYFAHVSPSGQLPWYWFQLVGYNYQFAGENLAVNFTDSTQVVDAWMNSPMHRANILKQNYTDIGIGVANGMYQGQEATFVVEFFGTPEPIAAAAPAPAPTQSASAPAPAQTTPEVAPASSPTVSQTPPEVPVETAAPAPGPAPAPGTPQILGVQTQNLAVPWWMKVVASPRTYATYLLFAIAAIFLAFLLLSLLPKIGHMPHPNALFNGGALVAVILAVIIVNRSLLASPMVAVPDSQHASVVAALTP